MMEPLLSNPCAARNFLFHKICGIASYTPTNSASVELQVFNFCLVDEAYTAPVPNIIRQPV